MALVLIDGKFRPVIFISTNATRAQEHLCSFVHVQLAESSGWLFCVCGHAHTYNRASREASAAKTVGRKRRRASTVDADSHFHLTREGEGWSALWSRIEPVSAGGNYRNKARRYRRNLPQAPPARNWIPTCGGWGDRAWYAGEVPAFGRCRGGSCLFPVLR